MCGITGEFYAKNIRKRLADPINDCWNLYQDQASRGTRGFGASIVAPDLTVRTVRATTEPSIAVDLKLWQGPVLGCLFHHRFPTSTENTLATTHPVLVRSKHLRFRYLVAHNGVIYNDDEIHADHIKRGYSYSTQSGKSFLDSEACAIELARVIEGKKTIATTGNQALVALQVNKETKQAVAVYFVTNGGNPLAYTLTGGLLTIASELEGTDCKPGTLYRFDLVTGKLTLSPVNFALHAKEDYWPVFSAKPSTSTVFKASESKHGWPSSTAPALSEPLEPATAGPSLTSPEMLSELSGADSGRLFTDKIGPLVEDVEEIIDEYADAIADPNGCLIASPDEYARRIASRLEEMRDAAIVSHANQITNEPADNQGTLVPLATA